MHGLIDNYDHIIVRLFYTQARNESLIDRVLSSIGIAQGKATLDFGVYYGYDTDPSEHVKKIALEHEQKVGRRVDWSKSKIVEVGDWPRWTILPIVYVPFTQKELAEKSEIKKITETFVTPKKVYLSVIFQEREPIWFQKRINIEYNQREKVVNAINDVIRIGQGEDIIDFTVDKEYEHLKIFDWALSRSGEKKDISADVFIEDAAEKETWKNRLVVFVTVEDISTKESRKQLGIRLGGLARTMVCALVSTAMHAKVLEDTGSIIIADNYLKSVVYHEVGHLFRVPSYQRVALKYKVAEKLGYHCTEDYCVMNQSMEAVRLKNSWLLNKPKLVTPSFCAECTRDLRAFFDDIREMRKAENVRQYISTIPARERLHPEEYHRLKTRIEYGPNEEAIEAIKDLGKGANADEIMYLKKLARKHLRHHKDVLEAIDDVVKTYEEANKRINKGRFF